MVVFCNFCFVSKTRFILYLKIVEKESSNKLALDKSLKEVVSNLTVGPLTFPTVR